MTCLSCKVPMYRVVNPADQSAKATCGRCVQWTDCAQCPKCHVTRCLGCYNKELTTFGKPREIRSEPIASDDMGI